MNRKILFIIALLIASHILNLIQDSKCLAFSKEKVILTTHNLFPYGSYPDGKQIVHVADDSFTGTAVDVVRCVFKKMGVPLEIQVVPWKRAQIMVQENKADGFFAGSQKDSRDQFAEMSVTIADQKWNWYLLKENPLNPKDPTFKAEASVCGFLGANMLQWMEENNYNVKRPPLNTEALLRMLLKKRVDAVMANNYVMDALLEKHNGRDKVKIYTNKNKPLGVYFSKSFTKLRPGFVEEFNKHVLQCRK